MDIQKYKKPILLGLAAAVLIIVLTLAYSLIFRSDTSEVTPSDGFPAGDGRTIVPAGQGSDQEGTGVAPGEEARLFQLHDRPAVSSVIFLRSGNPYVRFMEQGSGHVYEYDLRGKREYRISNTSVPQIQEALWSQDGSIVAFRYEDGGILKTAVGELSTTTQERSLLKVSFLPEGIRSLALSPDGASVFYIIAGQTEGTAQGIVARRDGASPKVVFTSKLPRWFVSWPSAGTLLASSPWSELGGIAYRIDPRTGAQSIAFTTPNMFVGIAGAPTGDLFVMDPASKRLANLVQGRPQALAAYGWPSSCTFPSQSTSTLICAHVPQEGTALSAQWERGEYDFAGDIFLMNTSTSAYEALLSPKIAEDRVFDAVNLAAAPDSSFVSFKNRVDGLLWAVAIR